MWPADLAVSEIKGLGNSPVVQWSGPGAFPAVAWIQSLVGVLRSGKLRGMAKKKKNKGLFHCESQGWLEAS